MNMHSKTLPSQPKARSRKGRQSVHALAMGTLMMSTLGVAPFSVSLVKADGKTKVSGSAAVSNAVKIVPVKMASKKIGSELQGAVLNLRIGKPLALAFPDNAKYSVIKGGEFVNAEVRDGLLFLNGLQSGTSLLVMESPFLGTQRFILKSSVDGKPAPEDAVIPALSWISTSSQSTAISPSKISSQVFSALIERRAIPRISTTSLAQLTPLRVLPAQVAVRGLPEIIKVAQTIPTIPSGMQPLESLTIDPPASRLPEKVQTPAIVPLNSDPGIEGVAQISPNVPVPSGAFNNDLYPTESPLPVNIQRTVNDPSVNRPQLAVSKGMARVLAFKQNILAVFYSDENVMDARAITARTLAITGKGTGRSTLAIMLAQSPDDVIGRAKIYNIDVYSTDTAPVISENSFTDPVVAQSAIVTALADPRVAVTVFQKPNSDLVARLTGTLRDQAEIEAAKSTADLFVPNVISSLFASPSAPALGDFVDGVALTNDGSLQAKLRNIFSNESIELVGLPGSTVLKASVGSISEAESILSLLPTLDRRIQPIIVIRGSADGSIYNSDVPVLYGEDYEMTRTLREVTGISTVYVKRTARNALALYGTVRSRADYDRIRRYAILLPQLQDSATGQNTTNVTNAGTPLTNASSATSISAIAPALATANGIAPSQSTSALTGLKDANAPSSGYQFPTQIQMFVRMTDENASAVRLVTVDSSVVEISRTALKDLGVQLGSVSLLSENITPATPGTIVTTPGGTTTTSAGTPSTVTREIDPTFSQGGFLGGNGFIGTGGFSNINPIRARLNALMQNGTAKILSKPNLTTIEGAEAQITVGGVRPIPSTQVSAGGGSSQTSVEFRRYGIILTMRPTVSDDDTILLQVRGDITDIDFTTAINLNGALIPGERVRSVDTTIAMREGDTLVMGGLITNESRKQTSRVPFLSQIPILGKLFQSKRFENNETELAIFLTPTIRRIQGSAGFFENFQASQGFPKLREEGRTTLDSASIGSN